MNWGKFCARPTASPRPARRDRRRRLAHRDAVVQNLPVVRARTTSLDEARVGRRRLLRILIRAVFLIIRQRPRERVPFLEAALDCCGAGRRVDALWCLVVEAVVGVDAEHCAGRAGGVRLLFSNLCARDE